MISDKRPYPIFFEQETRCGSVITISPQEKPTWTTSWDFIPSNAGFQPCAVPVSGTTRHVAAARPQMSLEGFGADATSVISHIPHANRRRRRARILCKPDASKAAVLRGTSRTKRISARWGSCQIEFAPPGISIQTFPVDP
jgi:hypothetical protein